MPLLTDLLASNTTDIASNTTAVASAGGKSKYLGSVEVTNTTTTYVEIDSTLITSSYTDYFIRLKSTTTGWPSGTYQQGATLRLEGYKSVQGIWQTPTNGAGWRVNSNGTSSNITTFLLDGMFIADAVYGSDKDMNLISDVELIKPLTADMCSISYLSSGADGSTGGLRRSAFGSAYYNYGYNDLVTAVRFTVEGSGGAINWPQGTVAHVYGIVDS